MSAHRVVGQRIARVDAPDKMTGRAIFAADVRIPDAIHAAVLRSPHAHARIKRLDVSRASKAEGVVAIITGHDLLQAQGLTEDAVRARRPSLVNHHLAWDKVVYAGQPVAAVAAVTLEQAKDAVRLIQVEYEVLPPVMDAEEAMKPGATVIHPSLVTRDSNSKSDAPSNVTARNVLSVGDVAAGFAQADVVL